MHARRSLATPKSRCHERMSFELRQVERAIEERRAECDAEKEQLAASIIRTVREIAMLTAREADILAQLWQNFRDAYTILSPVLADNISWNDASDLASGQARMSKMDEMAVITKELGMNEARHNACYAELNELKDRMTATDLPDAKCAELLRRRNRLLDDWSDLPVFTGSPPMSHGVCASCGSPTLDRQRRFCSDDCRRTHVEVFGI